MTSYRKRPVVIEAKQWVGNWNEIRNFMVGTKAKLVGRRIRVDTLEGAIYADEGDWIIRGVKGEFYPCKPDIFAATYDPVDAPAPAAPGETEALDGEEYGYDDLLDEAGAYLREMEEPSWHTREFSIIERLAAALRAAGEREREARAEAETHFGQVVRFQGDLMKARETVAFFASVIKSGESWSPECEAAMRQVRAARAASAGGER